MSTLLELLEQSQNLSISQSEAIRNGEMALLAEIWERKAALVQQIMGMAATTAAATEATRAALQHFLELEQEADALCKEAMLRLSNQIVANESASRRLDAVDDSYKVKPGAKGTCLFEEV